MSANCQLTESLISPTTTNKRNSSNGILSHSLSVSLSVTPITYFFHMQIVRGLRLPRSGEILFTPPNSNLCVDSPFE